LRAPALLFALLALAVAPAAVADDVISPAAEAVAVTIYRDGPVDTGALRRGDDTSGLALINETRTVDLPAGRTRIRFEGVADGVIPESAAIEGLPAVERNFDYDLLNPASMLAHAIGETVTLRRIDARTGKVTEEPAVVRSAPDGAVLQTAHGVEALHCGGGAEGLVFAHMPSGLADRPTLSAIVDAPAAGRYKLRLSYLSVRLNWSADYVARIAADGRSLDLIGWITLANRSTMSFVGAPTAVVAGNLSRVAVNLPQPNAPALDLACWPNQTTHSGWVYPVPPPPPPLPAPADLAVAMPVTVMAYARREALEKVPVRTTQSQLGDYKLYTLVEPTTVAAQQTKQIAFLHQPAVSFETVYAYEAAAAGDAGGDEGLTAATTTLRFENKPEKGLGQPLPQGAVWLRQTQSPGGELFIGSKTIDDVAIGAPFEIALGAASDVTVHARVVSDTHAAPHRRRLSFTVEVANAKPRPVVLEIRQPVSDVTGLAVPEESLAHGTKGGDPLWRLPLPANATATLTYSLEFDD
jgi:hypothetical protein